MSDDNVVTLNEMGRDQLTSMLSRGIAIEEEIKALREDRAELYKSVKAMKLNPKSFKLAINFHMEPSKKTDQEDTFSTADMYYEIYQEQEMQSHRNNEVVDTGQAVAVAV